MNDLRFFVISGQWLGDNERLCAVEPCLRLERFLALGWARTRTARSVGQGLKLLSYRGSLILAVKVFSTITWFHSAHRLIIIMFRLA